MTSHGPSGPLPPAAPATRSGARTAFIVVGVVSLALLLPCGLGGYALLRADPGAPETAAAPVPAVTRSLAAPDADASPTAGRGDEFRKGDCVVNDGTDANAELRKVPCGPGTYQVLSLIPFTTDGDRCQDDPVFGTRDADANYVHDEPLDIADYVLCLKKRQA